MWPSKHTEYGIAVVVVVALIIIALATLHSLDQVLFSCFLLFAGHGSDMWMSLSSLVFSSLARVSVQEPDLNISLNQIINN